MGTAEETFTAVRPRLLALAYRMLGSATDAEDMVSETYLRWHEADREAIAVPAAWLTKVLTNLCLNHLSSARVRREQYVGQWLPEPLLDGDEMLGPAGSAELRDSVSLAVLVLLDQLAPRERAVYVLREAFGFPHSEIAEMLQISEANSQQLLRRARAKVDQRPATVELDPGQAREAVERFLAAAATGKVEPLIELLTADVVSVGDGGGVVPARLRPIVGAGQVAVFLRGLFKATPAQLALIGGKPTGYLAWINGSPALLLAIGDRVVGALSFQFADGPDHRISALRAFVNPAKLGRLGGAWKPAPGEDPILVL